MAIAEVLPLAFAIALSPFPVIPAILLLYTPRARPTSLSFLAGWFAGIVVATSVFVLIADLVELFDEPPRWASWTRIALGAVLMALGVRQWITRNSSDDVPGWMASLAEATPAVALRLGVLLSAANPKILLLAAAGGLAIGSGTAGAGPEMVGVLVFSLVGSITVAVPVLLYAVVGERVLQPLSKVRDWLQQHNATIMAIVITVIGFALLAKGIDGVR